MNSAWLTIIIISVFLFGLITGLGLALYMDYKQINEEMEQQRRDRENIEKASNPIQIHWIGKEQTMAMYECENCGCEESTHPKVYLAINTTDPVPPYHRNKFEQKYGELGDWEIFFQWLCRTDILPDGPQNNGLKWFCSILCAMEYLQREYNKYQAERMKIK